MLMKTILIYFRSKINELTSEIGRLRKEVEVQSEDQSSYVSYEKR